MTSFIDSAVGWRWRFFRDGRCFTLGERLSYVTPRLGVRSQDELFLRRLRTAPDGAQYFQIQADKVFFEPAHEIGDRKAMVQGALTILQEVYFGQCNFFSGDVDLSPGDVVLDLGGNLGTSAIAFARRVGPEGRVYSFEPIFTAPLRRNLAENGIGNVVVVPAAVGDAPGEIDFQVTDIGIDSRFSNQSRPGASRRVRMTTLDAFVAEGGLERIDFIKADIEGAEEMALRGAREVIERFRPKWSIASYHTDPQGDKQHPKLVRLLRDYGYRTEELERRHVYAW